MSRLLVAALFTAIFLQTAAVSAGSLTLTMATGDDYPPWTDQDMKHGGLATYLVLRAFEAQGHFVSEIQWAPWPRAYELTKRQRVDGTFPWGNTEDRANFFVLSDPFLPSKQWAWVKSTSAFRPESRNDLARKVFCSPSGYGEYGMIKDLRESRQLRRETPATMAACFQMLAKGRVDFVAAKATDAENAMREGGVPSSEVLRTDIVLDIIPHHLLVAKGHPNAKGVIAAFNEGFATLKASGEWDEIKREYGWRD